MKRIVNIFVGLVFLITCWEPALAQKSSLVRANAIITENPVMAVKILDSVVRHAETRTLSISWTLRGRAYYEWSRIQNNAFKIELLDTIYKSVQKSFNFLPDSNITKDNYVLLRYVSKRYFNLASIQLKDTTLMKSMAAKKGHSESLKQFHSNALKYFNAFKKISETYFPNMDVKKYELEFYEALGSYFSYLFEKDNSNSEAGNLAKSAYLKVLELEPNNVFANIQMGLLYYNQAANIIQEYTGTLVSNCTVILPPTVQLYSLKNSTTGSFDLTFSTGVMGGTTLILPQGQTIIAICDGTNVYNAASGSSSSLNSLTLGNGSLAVPSLKFLGDLNSGMYLPASGQVGFVIANALAGFFNTSGLTVENQLTAF